ncbi:sodium/glucose cotransporter 4-like isoform X4 [Acanthaster planci]|uniref:Sodium/glucose cotransporter 4-like isoform X4 n=1 Tax=Acanthaster planci TaxID=133434 RepID=A0A8B7XR56_ACAPL|nr:sodium/glucose cotransporter 4-like isoform X4 [Acanthaster planci]
MPEEAINTTLVAWDYVAIATYFVLVLCVGLFSLCRSNRGTVSGYFLAGRYMTWLPVGASLFASNIGSEHFVGLAGSGAAGGIGVGAFELNACLLIQLLGWVFLPVFIASGVYTLPEYMRKRFGGQRIRVYLAMLSLVLYIFTKISVNLFSGALFLQQALNWNIYLAVGLLLLLTAICTVTGGLAAVIYTDTLQFFIMLFGACMLMILNEVACASEETCMAVCGSPSGCSNIAYPKLALGVLPVGLRGVMLAVMLAALMSDLTSIFNSTSTLFTIDIWKYFRAKCCKKAPSVRELMVVGRLVVVVMTVISILWIPVIQRMQGGQLFIYIQEISSFLAPPIAAVYLVALLWPRGNEKGAFWGLVVGFIVGVIRMILDFTYRAPPCWGVDRRPAITAKVHYMYFALILFWITVIVNVVVSLLTVPPQKQMLIRTTWWTRFEKGKRVDDFEDDKEEIELNDGLQVVTSEGQLETKRSLVRRGYDWFCGYDDTFAGRTKACQHRAHLREVSALKQDPRAKIFLNINLVLIILVASTLYVIFSIPGLL